MKKNSTDKEKEFDLIKISMNKAGNLSIQYTENFISALQSSNNLDMSIEELKLFFSSVLDELSKKIKK